jgi:predicted outer membrane repeat protein
VTAAIDPHWLGKYMPRFTGVTWDEESCGDPGCMLIFCGSTQATFTKLVVRGVQHTFDMGVLCIAGESNVSMLGADISYNIGSGGLAVWEDAQVHITGGSRVSNNIALNATGGGLCAWDNAKVSITGGSVFTGNVAKGFSGGGISAQNSATVLITNSTIANNTSEGVTGGGLCAEDDATVVIRDGSMFISNIVVLGNGGGLSALNTARITISSSVFARNNASYGEGGGVFASNNAKVVIQNHTMLESNIASFSPGGGGLALARHATARIAGGSKLINNSAEISSGGGISARGNSTLVVDGGSIVESNHATLYGGGLYVVQGAVVDLRNAIFSNNSATYAGKDISASADGNLVLGLVNLNMSSPTLSWTREMCIIGEVKSQERYCVPCASNTYSLNASASACNACPSHANCTGKDAIVPLQGYWHSHKYSTQVHKCPRADSCDYGGKCGEGYEGHVCGSCRAGYGTTLPLRCSACGSVGHAVALYVSGVVITVLVLSLLVHTTVNDNISGAATLRPSHFLKIWVRHVQYLVILGSLRIDWPSSLTAFFAAASWLFSVTSSYGGAVSLDCIISKGPLPHGTSRLLVALLAPIGVLFCVLVLRVVVRFVLSMVRGRPNRQAPQFQLHTVKVDVVAASLVVLFFFYPSMVKAPLSVFACYTLDEAGSSTDPYSQYAIANAAYGYWVSNIQQACWEGWHLSWALGLGLPCMLLLFFGVPLGCWLLLYKNRSRLQEPGFREYSSFLYHDYTPKRYYWETLNTVQIALSMALLVFSFTLGAYLSCLLLNLALACFCALQHTFRPFASVKLHRMNLASLVCLYFTTTLALTLLTTDRALPSVYGDAAGIIGLVANLSFLLWCMYSAGVHSTGAVSRFCRKCIFALRKCFTGRVQKRTSACTSSNDDESEGSDGDESDSQGNKIKGVPPVPVSSLPVV